MRRSEPSSMSGAGTTAHAVVGIEDTKTNYISVCLPRQRKTTLDLKQGLYSKALVTRVMEQAEKPNGMVRQT